MLESRLGHVGVIEASFDAVAAARVVEHLGIGGVAQHAVVGPGKMAAVDVVLDVVGELAVPAPR